ncbi:hypothetical protein V1478_004515 [Vespula squamosa]|uniref:Uncharacterized protein n=1 Tax=Vespula squamosa TaxID=30214 RepID=A0ABD2BGF1_VESSQ
MDCAHALPSESDCAKNQPLGRTFIYIVETNSRSDMLTKNLSPLKKLALRSLEEEEEEEEEAEEEEEEEENDGSNGSSDVDGGDGGGRECTEGLQKEEVEKEAAAESTTMHTMACPRHGCWSKAKIKADSSPPQRGLWAKATYNRRSRSPRAFLRNQEKDRG